MVQEPFPALTSLYIEQYDGLASGDIFLNGSAPNLQHLTSWGISIPRGLGSATHLRSLYLADIPKSGYIPPETVATSLSALPQLESLFIEFEYRTPHPKRRNRPVPQPTRFVLPALTGLRFKGVSEYLEVLTAQIDAPLLDYFNINFFNQPVFDIPQIIRFIGHQDFKLFRSSSLTLHFSSGASSIGYDLKDPERSPSWFIWCRRLDWQVFSITQICSQIMSFRSSVESLNIRYDRWHSDSLREDDSGIDPTLWLQLFHSFTSVQSLEISELLIAAALTGQPTTDVLPSLRSISIVSNSDADETTEQGIQSFIAARQRSGRPVTVTRREIPDDLIYRQW
jgi:hypothetical protein